MALVRSSLLRTGCPFAEMMRSPSRSPAALAGFSLPSAVYRSENATTSAPSENSLTPKGVPHSCTVRRAVVTARTVLTGTTPNNASVTLLLVSGAVLSSGTAPCFLQAERYGSEAMRSSAAGSSV